MVDKWYEVDKGAVASNRGPDAVDAHALARAINPNLRGVVVAPKQASFELESDRSFGA
jgi:hypothetical protein